MGLFDLFKKDNASKQRSTQQKILASMTKLGPAFVDSSSVSPDERPYYQEDSYYTLYSYPDTPMAQKVITFDERKQTARPSTRGLYPAEILLLSYCKIGKYPKPKSGYPGLWWFEYGIRDVGHALESLATRGYLEWAPKTASLHNLKVDQLKQILETAGLPSNGKKQDLIDRIVANLSDDQIIIPGYSPKYQLTTLGEDELEQNGYVPYMHKHKRKTAEDSHFGETFNVWSINKKFQNGDASDWRNVVGAIEVRLFGMDIVNAEPVEKPVLKTVNIRQFLQSSQGYIASQIKTPGDGFDEEMKGIELKKAGRDDEAIVQFYIAIGKKFDAPALYQEAAVLLRKYKMYSEEVEVLESGLKNVPKSNAQHWEGLSARLEKARALAAK
ncbi:SAP domain-containing protein [Adlercreutzia sp. ZJ141]|uniref:SAP domain-containing protein n=1 Tax=Adlercreutzia sp. ZJ141 TaxID=2709406 RepID=UPI0013EC511C|nr:SAP domain-containing protein [Adlercreutzia sp. ZJ141]